MRLLIAALAVIPPLAVHGQEGETSLTLPAYDPETEFELGGAASRSALVEEISSPEGDPVPPQPRLTLPRSPGDQALDLQEASLGPATFFVGSGRDSGRDAVQMGTFVSRGGARAGLSVTYLSREEEVSRSELFVDYALNQQLSVGVSGILNTEIDSEDPVPQLGVSAEYSSVGGSAYLQGGVAAGSEEYDPVIGVSIGLRF